MSRGLIFFRRTPTQRRGSLLCGGRRQAEGVLDRVGEAFFWQAGGVVDGFAIAIEDDHRGQRVDA